jgi:hypothetical protein
MAHRSICLMSVAPFIIALSGACGVVRVEDNTRCPLPFAGCFQLSVLVASTSSDLSMLRLSPRRPDRRLSMQL